MLDMEASIDVYCRVCHSLLSAKLIARNGAIEIIVEPCDSCLENANNASDYNEGYQDGKADGRQELMNELETSQE